MGYAQASPDWESLTAELAYGRGSVLGWARACTPYEQLLRHITYTVELNDDLNACAYMDSDGLRRVELNSGVSRELYGLMSRAILWRELGECLGAKRIGRERAAHLAVGACVDFIVWHEIQHHGLGHVGYFHQAGDPGLHERSVPGHSPEPASRPMSAADWRACELSADGQAASFIWRHQACLRADPDSRYYGVRRADMLRIVAFAGMLTFACIANGEPLLRMYDLGLDRSSKPDPNVNRRRARYPHPAVRAMHVDAQLERQAPLWWLRGDRRITKDALGAVVSLAKTQECSLDLFEPILHEKERLQVVSESIAGHWDHIRSDVEQRGLWVQAGAYD